VTSRRALAAALLLLLSCCDGVVERSTAATRVSVFAASSLTDAFTDLGASFEASNDGVSLSFNFLSSSDLAAQIEQGAPADVFASADEASMDRVVEAGLNDGHPEVFAHNRLEIIVSPGNPLGIDGLADLAEVDLVLSLCNAECPAGRYALAAMDKAGVDVVADSLESEVKGVVTRVETGEADAGIVYATDVRAARGDVEGVVVPRVDNVLAAYPIVALDDAPTDAQAFVEYVVSREGQDVLREFGFLSK
jgi:molybdate transport system substrate-binding protein